MPVLVSLVFVYAVVGVLGWWRPVCTDDRPVRRWVWIIPAIMAVTFLAGGAPWRGSAGTACLHLLA